MAKSMEGLFQEYVADMTRALAHADRNGPLAEYLTPIFDSECHNPQAFFA